ncbi:MAG: restriction endonuclease [Candidatus Nomurabacteria bacterium]|jgi:hypothetical protein|nr:restriction endonuclease [Candidatus Nomurabacteria bacterium]
MSDEAKSIINQAVRNMIEKAGSPAKIKSLKKKHDAKVHFIPKRYRVFGGLLQSLNIQFGNFIEELMKLLVENDGRYEIVTKYSGKKSNNFLLSAANDDRIDRYISECQLEPDGFCNIEFPKLERAIIDDGDRDTHSFKHDIDLLFREKATGRYFYLEIKYNDDHDTGKFVDINRKFIKTYAYLVLELGVKNIDELTPILFFFNNKKAKGNIYVPEATNIRRGKGFFDEFLRNVTYAEVNDYMANLSENGETVKMFDELYRKVVKA